MDDQALLKRLAEIEGWQWWTDPLEHADPSEYWVSPPSKEPMDPITNDAQAMGLVKKHKLSVEYDGYDEAWDVESLDGAHVGGDESLNRAICLAVIAAHEGGEEERHHG